MKNPLFKSWWLLTVKGVLLFLLGLVALIFPEQTILVLATWLGAFIFIAGLIGLCALLFIGERFQKIWGWLVLEAALDMALGLVILFYPSITIMISTVLLALWLLMAGAFQIVYAFQIRPHSLLWWLPLFNGLITTTLAVLIGINPFEGSVFLTYLIGAAAIFFAFMLIITSFALRRWRDFYKRVSI